MDFIHFTHHQFAAGAIGDDEQHFLRIENIVVVQQRRVKSICDGLCYTAFSFSEACTHNGDASVFQNGLDVVKVKVDRTAQGNDFSNALGCDGECVIGFTECIHYADIGINVAQAFVVDHQQGIDMFAHLFHAVQGLVDLFVAFEYEGDCNNTYCQDVHFLGSFGNNRCSTGSGTSTHSGCDKGHPAAVVQHFLYIFQALFGSSTRTFRTVTGTEAFASELDFLGDRRLFERLIVCIADHERNVVDTFSIHVVDSITAATAYTDHFNDARCATFRESEGHKFIRHNSSSLFIR